MDERKARQLKTKCSPPPSPPPNHTKPSSSPLSQTSKLPNHLSLHTDTMQHHSYYNISIEFKINSAKSHQHSSTEYVKNFLLCTEYVKNIPYSFISPVFEVLSSTFQLLHPPCFNNNFHHYNLNSTPLFSNEF